MEGSNYPQTPANTVNRLKTRANYDATYIHNLVNSTPVLHVSFNPDITSPNPTPIILPMIGQVAQYDKDSAPHCYLHGYVTNRLMKMGASAGDEGEGLPVCVAATKFDGIVLALTPFNHSYDYRSAVLQGLATIVEDPDERLWAMKLITDSVLPGRWENSRVPPDNAEMQSTRIMKVRITAGSAKVREGGPGAERKDLRREDVLEKVWTGVIPHWERYGEPVPSEYNKVKEVPDYITDFARTESEIAEKHAVEVAKKEYPGKKKKNEQT